MYKLSTVDAREQLDRLVDQAAQTHQPIGISSRHSAAVLVSQESWDSIQETLYLLSVPGLGEEIREGMKEPIQRGTQELNW